MTAQTILIIRHGEKPEPGGDSAVDETGAPDPKSLTPRGWQRAGAWAELFAPSLGQPGALPAPAAIFASAPGGHAETAGGDVGSKSRRPLETITPLAARLGIDVDLRFAKGQEAALAMALLAAVGVTLVCWQHEDIFAIATAIAPNLNIPSDWPGDRFNVVFRLQRADDVSPWAFDQVAPVMLDGDEASPI